MAERDDVDHVTCTRCGEPVSGAVCDHCGAPQSADAVSADTAPQDAPAGDATSADPTHPHDQVPDDQVPDDQRPAAPALTAKVRRPPVVLEVDADDDPDAPRTAEQPWHPFEQPSWLDATADPRVTTPGGFLTTEGTDFMGVSQWDGEDAEIVEERRRPWLLGALAAVAVVIVLAVVAFVALRSGSDTSSDQGVGTVVVPATATSPVADSTTAAAAETTAADTAVVPTVTSPDTTDAATSVSDTSAGSTAAADPLGGPQRDITCAPGYVVQIASGGDEASFTARVAELRAAGQLPADAAVARTASSCAIFAGQANSVVLYTGPYAGPYDGCGARLAGAPDSFVKGTTPETASVYVSCLCPTQVVTVPTFDAIGQTGVWVGELQRILGNRLTIPIPDLQGNWGTFTDGTSAAVKTFQSGAGLPVTGIVDAGTWQALQQAEC